nr:hypothetical protein [Candidatus Sigynarchaeota archaeon]
MSMNETMPPVDAAGLVMSKLWSNPATASITFHLKSRVVPVPFQKCTGEQFIGVVLVGPALFYVFASPGTLDGTRTYYHVNIDDIARFDVLTRKPVPAPSPPAPAAAPVQD